jgi:hypothetical protein
MKLQDIKEIRECYSTYEVNNLLKTEGWIFIGVYPINRQEVRHSTSNNSNFYSSGSSINIQLNNPPDIKSDNNLVYIVGRTELGNLLFNGEK